MMGETKQKEDFDWNVMQRHKSRIEHFPTQELYFESWSRQVVSREMQQAVSTQPLNSCGAKCWRNSFSSWICLHLKAKRPLVLFHACKDKVGFQQFII